MPADDTNFRGAMRLLASGVTIVATRHGNVRSGMTATAVCSLALSPPRVLASLNHTGQTFELLSQSRVMSVNILAQDHEDLARRFAARRVHNSEERFAGTEWCERVTGAPLLNDALAALDCRITDLIPLDTHAIVIGLVEDIVFGPRRPPLLHFESAFTTALGASTEGLP